MPGTPRPAHRSWFHSKAHEQRRTLIAWLAALALLVSSAPILLLAQPADAYEVNPTTGSWSGAAGATSSTLTEPSGLVVTATTTLKTSVQDNTTTLGVNNATSNQFTPNVATTTPALRLVTTVGDCPATGTCAARGTLTLAFSQPVTNPVLHISGIGGFSSSGTASSALHTVFAMTSSPAGATLGAVSAGATNLKVTGGNTIDVVDPKNTGACDTSSSAIATTATAGCGSVPVLGTVSSITFSLTAVLTAVANGGAVTSAAADAYSIVPTFGQDFSDAPASYDTSGSTTQAPAHLVGDLALGAGVDADNTTTANATASPFAATGAAVNTAGDNTTGADEDAISTPWPRLTTGDIGSAYTLTVPISGASKAGQVCGWIDFNRSGAFDTGERACGNFVAGNTSVALTWTVPAATSAGPTYARLRAAYNSTGSNGASSPVGPSDSGEVEDYALTVMPTVTVTKTLSGGATGTFNLSLNGTNYATGVGNGGSTGPQTVAPNPASATLATPDVIDTDDITTGNVSVRVGEANASGNSAQYSSAYTCTDGNGTVVQSGNSTSFTVSIPRSTGGNGKAQTITCAYTNTPPAQTTSCPTPVTIDNGSFEAPVVGIASGAAHFVPQSTPGVAWKTTAADGVIEYWTNGGTSTAENNNIPITAQSGIQWVELNANATSNLYQDEPTTPGQIMHWSIWHRARGSATGNNGNDVMQVQIGTTTTQIPQVPTGQTSPNISDGPNAWVNYQGNYTVPAGQTTTRFQFAAISTSSGNVTVGNFLDNIVFANSACIQTSKTVTDLTAGSGSLIRPGDTLQYTVTAANNGADASSATVISDNIPTGTSYLPGSLTVGGVPVTDASSDDAGEYNGSAVVGRIGTGASATAGGALAAGASSSLSFKVTVNSTVTAGTGIANLAATSYVWPANSGNAITSYSNTTSSSASTTGIKVVKTVSGTTDVNANGRLDAGDRVNYSFVVTDTGSTALTAVGVTDAKAGTVTCPSATLAAGASIICTASYTLTQADVNAGVVNNSATATGTPPGGAAPITSAASTATQTIPAVATLGVTKSASATTITAAGQLITYTVVATNTGNVTLSNVAVTDALTAPAAPNPALTCSPVSGSTLAPGASISCTASYTSTQADVDNGKIVNTATATGNPPTGAGVTGTATAMVTATQNPNLSIVKSASRSTISAPGQLISYTFAISNTGNTTLNSIALVDQLAAPATPASTAVTCPATVLAPGAGTTCTIGYTSTQADIDNGSVTDTGSVTARSPSGATLTRTSSVTVAATVSGTLSLTKSASRSSIDNSGQSIVYSFAVTNGSNVTISGLAIADTFTAPAGPVPAISCPTTTLAPGASTTCTGTYTTTAADINAGSVVNSATASGKNPAGTTVTSNTATASVTAAQAPALSLTKTANVASINAAGQLISYTFAVTNSGNTSISNLTVADVFTAPAGPVPAISCAATSLAAGSSTTCTGSYPATQADVDKGSIANTATVSGKDPNNATVTSPVAAATVAVNQTPKLTVIKSATPATITGSGKSVNYSFVVSNAGNVTITGVAIADTATAPAGVPATISCPASSLAPGASTTCTGSYASTAADVDAGSITDSATATGRSPAGATVTSTASTATVTASQTGSLQLSRTINLNQVTTAGQQLVYTYTISNNGNVTVTNPATAVTFQAPGGPAPAVSCAATTLAAGASTTCTMTYTVTQADVDAGSVRTSSTASGKDPNNVTVNSNAVAGVTPVVQSPKLTVTKTADRSTVTAAGQNVNYSFAVTNAGNVTVGTVSIADVLTAPAGPVPTVSCPATALAPGNTLICTATYAATQADLNAGSITDSATASGKDPGNATVTSGPSTATVTAIQTNALTLTKAASPSTVATVGQTVTYSFAVTNSGNTTISGIAVNDTATAPGGVPATISCPSTTLAPGASTTCTGTYTVSQADLNAGSIKDSATATGLNPANASVTSNASTATVTATQTGKLSLTKSASPASVNSIGAPVSYTFAVTNTGNVTVSNLSIADTFAAPAGPVPAINCPVTTLAPGASTTCTAATYSTTVLDVANGSIGNSAVANGTDPAGRAVASNSSNATVSINQLLALSLTKSASPTTVTTAGSPVTYTFAVTNTGNLAVTGLNIVDTFTAPAGPVPAISCAATSLAAGASTTCTGTYSTSQADLNAGSIANSAQAKATGINLIGVTSNTSTATVAATQNPKLTLATVANPATVTAAGQQVSYTFTVGNTGNVTVSNLAIADTFTAPAGPVPAITCAATSLAPGASTTCTATYTATQADVDAGSIKSAATVSGKDPKGNTITSASSAITVGVTRTRSATLTKSASPTSVSAAGTSIGYLFLVTNTGNTTLSALSVTDTVTAPAGPVPTVACPTGAVAPGASAFCTANYTATQADLDAGSITDSATATLKDPAGTTVTTNASTATVSVNQTPALTLTETASAQSVSAPGQSINYTFAVTNSGNVSVSSLSISDAFTAPGGPVPAISCLTGTLAPGASTTCTGSYSVSQADLDAGSIVNSSTAVATQSVAGTTVTSNPASVTVAVAKNAALTMVKSATPATVSAAGSTVGYSFAVTNSGNVTITGLAIADTLTAPAGPVPAISCPASTLAPGAATTCTASYSVKQADLDKGSILNSATASGRDPQNVTVTSAASTAGVSVTAAPALTLVKTATPDTISSAGSAVAYSFTITNSGNVTLSNLSVADTFSSPAGPELTVSCPATSLAPGAKLTCTANYTATQADVDRGSIANSAVASGRTPAGQTVNSATANATVTIPAAGALTVLNTASPAAVTAAGQVVNYTVRVTNSGNVTVNTLAATNTLTSPAGPAPAISCPVTTLAPGISTNCTASYTVTQADLDKGSIVDSAVATGKNPAGGTVTSNSSAATVTVTQTSALTVQKSASPSRVSAVGSTVTYSFAVSNTGNTTISALAINDTFTAPAGPVPAVSCPVSTLSPGGSTTCTGNYSVKQADLTAGSITNSATASGQNPAGGTVTSPASTATVAVTQQPQLNLSTSFAPATVTAVGQPVTYTFTVSNTGNVPLTGLAVTDTLAAPAGPSPTVSCATTALAAGASTTCTATYTATQADVDKGSIVGSATATAIDPNARQVTSPASASTVPVARTAKLSLVKSAGPTAVTTAGQTVDYAFAVTNTGNVTVTGLFIDDTLIAPAGPVPGVSCPVSTLAPGASTSCTASYTASQADLNSGSITNSATAGAKDPANNTVNSAVSTATVTATQAAALTLTAVASPVSVTAAGQSVAYTVTVTNTGNVTLNTLAVTDTFTAPAGPPPALTCQASTLAPSASTTCIGNYTVTQADLDKGSIANAATATAKTPQGVPVTSNTGNTTVTVIGNARLSLVKSASPTSISAAGTTIAYSFTVTNTGNLTLTGLAVADTFAAPAGPGTAVSCPVSTLAPGAATTCTSSYASKQADLDAGSIANSATASAKDPANNPVNSAASTATVAVVQGPALSITRSTSPATVTAAGQTVDYSFVVRNTGNTTVTGIAVVDDFTTPAGPAPAVSCPVGTLAPGAATTCTAGYTVTQADIDKGSISDTDTATGSSGSTAVSSTPVQGTVGVTQTSALTVAKSAAPTSVTAAGQSINYSFLVRNTGNTTLSLLSVTDVLTAPAAPAPDVSCPSRTVAPGTSITCTATYTVTQADVDAGSLSDVGSATAQDPSGRTISSAGSGATVSVGQTSGLRVTDVPSPDTVTAVGQTVSYSFAVTNTGTVTLNTIAVTNTFTAPAGPGSAVSCPTGSLAPGATVTCMASYTTTQADLDAGSIQNSATATARTPGGVSVASAPATATVTAAGDPALTLTKTAGPLRIDAAGQTVGYSFAVTNSGNVTILGLSITDTFTAPAGPGGAISCPTSTLAAGASTTCTSSYVATQADIDAGSVVNTATASGQTPLGTPVASAPSSATVSANQAAALQISQTASPTTVTAVGQNVAYTFTVTNTGNLAVTGIAVTDTLAGPGGPSPTVSCPVTTLAPGASTTCTAGYRASRADLDNGSITDNAVATGTATGNVPVVSNNSTTTVTAVRTPGLTVSTTTSTPSVDALGQTYSYTYTVTNNGNVTVTGLAITQSFAAPATTPPAATCGVTTLAAGASTSCTTTYTVTQADLDNGGITSAAAATGTDPAGGTVTSTMAATTEPAVQRVSGTATQTADPTTVSAAGQVIQYTFTLTNNGNVTLSGGSQTDTLSAPAGPPITISCPTTTSRPGDVITCTASYTVTQADVDHGSVTNTAVFSARTPDGVDRPLPATVTTVAIAPAGALSIVKSASPTSVTAAGQTVGYSFAVTNTGNVTATNLTVSDRFTSPGTANLNVSCPTGTLSPGASTTCTANYQATQDDLDAGSFSNSATASATTPAGVAIASSPSTATVTATGAASLRLTATASPGTVTAAGQPVSYAFTVTNTGNVTVTGIAIDDAFAAPGGPVPVISCPASTLAPGASTTCTATYPASQADLDAGSISNTATATGTSPANATVTSGSSSTTVGVTQRDSLALAATVSPGTVTTAGSTLTYTFTVTNTGNTTAGTIAVSNTFTAPAGPPLAISCAANTLAPNATTTCTASYPVTQADIDKGSVRGTATATGTDPSGLAVASAPAATSVSVTRQGALTLVKTASRSSVTAAGQTVGYSFAVTNSGNLTLSSISVEDDFTPPAGPTLATSCPVTTLAPGASTTCTGTYTATQADLDNGSIGNSATASAVDSRGGQVTSPASAATVSAGRAAALTLTETTNPASVDHAGQTVNYTFAVTNSGNVTVTGIGIGDTLSAPAGPALAISCAATSLAPGTSTSCTATYTATQADLDAGAIVDTARATGKDPAGSTVTSNQTGRTVTADRTSTLSLQTTVAPTSAQTVGQRLTFAFAVTNTGNVTVSSLSIAGTLAAPAGPTPAVHCPAGPLAPGASVTCTASYPVTQADLDNGSITLTGTARGTTGDGTPVVSAPSSATAGVSQNATLTVQQSTSTGTVTAAGQPVTYTITVANAGNVTVTGLTAAETFTAPAGPGTPTCPATSLAPGASTTCTLTYTATQADIDHGSITGTATATGSNPAGNPVTSNQAASTVTAEPTATLSAVKTADPDTVSAPGQTVLYTVAVVNTGTVTLNSLGITDVLAGPAGPAVTISCPVSTLAPSAGTDCTGTYTATQADLDNGSITNSAIASGKRPNGTAVTSKASAATISVAAQAQLALTEAVSTPTFASAGQSVRYTFTVTNNGNQTISGIAVTDAFTAPAGPVPAVSCAANTLAPNAQTTCTTAYTVTQADLDHGSIVDSAIASGVSPAHQQASSNSTGQTVTALQAPGISLSTAVSPGTYNTVGQHVTYTFTVTNTGNTTSSGASVSAAFGSPAGPDPVISCPATAFAPGAHLTCTATYTVTQADLDHGSLSETAIAKAVNPDGSTVSSAPVTSTVDAVVTATISLSETVSSPTYLTAGQLLTYSYSVTNTGTVTVSDAVIAQSFTAPAGPGSTPACPAGSVAPGATITCTSTYTVTQADLDNRTIVNGATATATGPSGSITSNATSQTVTAVDSLGLSLTATSTPASYATAGQQVSFSYTVGNTGNQTVTGLTVPVVLAAPGTPPMTVSCAATSLAPGASTVCTATHTVTQADLDNGKVTATATAIATAPGGSTVGSQPVTTVVTAAQSPALSLAKSATPTTVAAAGDHVTYTFAVTNTGNVSLTDLAVDDSLAAPAGPALSISCPTTSLAPAASTSCTGVYPVTEADLNSGTISNSATAGGTAGGTSVTSQVSTATVTVAQSPGLALTKRAAVTDVNGDRRTDPGDTVSWTFALVNTGNVTLTGVAVNDPTAGAVSCPATTLAAGASTSCTAPAHTISTADARAGTVDNTATASGLDPRRTPVGSAPSSTSTVVSSPPSLQLVKNPAPVLDANHDGRVDAGDTVTYTYTVTNNGNTALTGVTVLDPRGGTIACSPDVLLPGASVTCTGTPYTVTQDDMQAGSIDSTATGSATDPLGETVASNPSEVSTPLAAAPSIALVKTATTADVNADGITDPGDQIHYRFTVTNTGTVVAGAVAIADARAGTVTCAATTLAPGASTQCVAAHPHTITAADARAGAVVNTAIATASCQAPPRAGVVLAAVRSCPTVSSRASQAVTAVQATPVLHVLKTARTVDADHDGQVDAGDTVLWTITVHNIGNVPVRGIVVSDPTAGRVQCPATTLAAGAEMVCTVAPHTITAADAGAGQVSNTATASGAVLGVTAGSTVGKATVRLKRLIVPVANPGGGNSGPIAYTGAGPVLPITFLALVAILAGLVLLAAARRRREQR